MAPHTHNSVTHSHVYTYLTSITFACLSHINTLLFLTPATHPQMMKSLALLLLLSLTPTRAAPLAYGLCVYVTDYIPSFCTCEDQSLGAKIECDTTLFDIALGMTL